MRQEFRCEVLRHNAPSHFTAASPKPKLMITASKMAIILPTGQWYAPSVVINDAWYCMILHCIA